MREHTRHLDVIYSGQLLRLEVLDVELEDGTRSIREVVRHPGAVAVVARKADGTHVFVRQFRKAVERYMVEVVAGTLHKGEAPEACARREVEEETGLRVREIQLLGDIYPSPGYVDERIVVFAAAVEPGGEGVQDPDERVETVEFTVADFERQILEGAILDSKTLACWTLYRLKLNPGRG